MEGAGGTILIVDDEESIRDILCRKLQSQGYNCVAAADSNEALWKAFMQDFDLVLMDIRMPVMNGLMATKKIRSIDKKIPIVAQTAYAMEEDKNLSIEAGCNDHLPKPLSRNKLLKIISQHLSD
ncbi:MAG: response regulator [Dehalococcoidia bacterium]